MGAPAQQHRRRYKELVQSIRTLRAQSVRCEVEAMLLVLDLERQSFLWKDFAPKFEDVIARERFCTVRRWRAFKRARAGFPRKDKFVSVANNLGVEALCLISVQPDRVRFRLLRQALNYRERHDIEPTYQYVTQLLGKRKRVSQPSRRELLRKIERLQRNVETLKSALRENQIKIPNLERV